MPSGTVTVTVDGAGDDLSVNRSTLTFNGTTWATAQTVTVEAVDVKGVGNPRIDGEDAENVFLSEFVVVRERVSRRVEVNQ